MDACLCGGFVVLEGRTVLLPWAVPSFIRSSAARKDTAHFLLMTMRDGKLNEKGAIID